MRCAILVGAFLVGLGLIGCGGTTTPTGQNGPSADPNATTVAAKPAGKPVSVPANATPDQVVSVFLDALRGGDQATTAALLTAKALTETSQRNLSVCPQATPNMQYQVTKSEVLPENPSGAHVNVTWSETYPDGTVSYEVVWVLRKQPEGWRVAGMAIELVPGQGLAFLNFEDPDDMIRKQEEAMAALSPPAAKTAAVPSQPAPVGSGFGSDNTGVANRISTIAC
jgi:hypothetical protein